MDIVTINVTEDPTYITINVTEALPDNVTINVEETGGPPGPSAYDVWITEGNSGTVQDYLDSLKGQDGTNGVDGSDGTNGTNGVDGVDGLSAYEQWINEGNSGTIQDFLDSLQGADGVDGTNGTNGINGTNGTDGNDGADGTDGVSITTVTTQDNGDGTIDITFNKSDLSSETITTPNIQGNDGADGQDGAQGLQGNPGVDGQDGADGQGVPTGGTAGQLLAKIDGTDFNTEWVSGGSGGEDGRTILNGSGAPSGGLGEDGDFYIDTTNNDIYGPKSGTWGSATSLVGPQGVQGNPGNDGNDGADGTNGINGTNGNDGADGKTILNGSGVPGSGLGVDGDFYIDTTNDNIYGPKTGGSWGASTSLIGPQGIQGIQGIQGNPGADGADGADGQGVPTGGSTGQILEKVDGTDFNTQWASKQSLSDLNTAGVTDIVQVTQATYDGLTPDANTLYLIIG